MEINKINEIANNLIFKKIEEEALSSYKESYKKSPLELLFNKNSNKLFETILSTESLENSVSIYYCLSKIKNLNKIYDFLQSATNEKDETYKNIFISNLKYIEYLNYNKDKIDIKNLHKFLSDIDSSVTFLELFEYLLLNRCCDKNSYKKYAEFIIFLIAKIDDLNCSFNKKWGELLNTINKLSLMYFNTNNINSISHGINTKNIVTSSPTTYNNLFESFNKTKESKELKECLIPFFKTIFKYIYNLISLKHKKYDLFKYIFNNDFLYESFKNNLKMEKYSYDDIHISNFQIIENGLKIHKSNLNKIKKYINEFNEDELKILKEDGNIFTYILFENYFNDLKMAFDKYYKYIEKIKI